MPPWIALLIRMLIEMRDKPDTFLVGEASWREVNRFGAVPNAPAPPPMQPFRGWCPFWDAKTRELAIRAVSGKTKRAVRALSYSALQQFRQHYAGAALEPTVYEQKVIERLLQDVENHPEQTLLEAIRVLKVLLAGRMGAASLHWRASPDCSALCCLSNGTTFPLSKLLQRSATYNTPGGPACRCDVIPNLTWESDQDSDSFLRAYRLDIHPSIQVRYSDEKFQNAPTFWKPCLDRFNERYGDRFTRVVFVADAYDEDALQRVHRGPPLFGLLPFWKSDSVIYVSDYAVQSDPIDHILIRSLIEVNDEPPLVLPFDHIENVAPHVIEKDGSTYRANRQLVEEIGEAEYKEECLACGLDADTIEALFNSYTPTTGGVDPILTELLSYDSWILGSC